MISIINMAVIDIIVIAKHGRSMCLPLVTDNKATRGFKQSLFVSWSLAAPCSYGLSVAGFAPLYHFSRSLLFTLDLKTKGLKCPLPYLQFVTLNFTTCSFEGAWARKNYKWIMIFA